MNASINRVAVTGMGIISPSGNLVNEFWENLLLGRCATQDFHTEGPSKTLSVRAAPVNSFQLPKSIKNRYVLRSDRFSQFAVAAALQASEDANLSYDFTLESKAACILGSAIGGQSTVNSSYESLLIHERNVHPMALLKSLPSSAASLISILLGITESTFAVSSACASATHAISIAAGMVQRNEVDIAFTGGAEASLTYGGLSAWSSMKVMSPDFCRPFDKNRNGLIIGEGAGVLVLESWEHAINRGAKIHAEVIASGSSSDAMDMLKPSEHGGVKAIKAIIDKFDITKASKHIYINAHGTGTKLNDLNETKILKSIFQEKADDLVISSTKSMHGHLLGAAGAIEAIATILAIKHGVAPPTINLTTKDQNCNLNWSAIEPTRREFKFGLSNSFAFGGLNSSVLFKSIS